MAPPSKNPKRVSSNALAFSELCLALNDSEYSKSELVELTGVGYGTVKMWMDYLRARKLIYICQYRKNHSSGAYEAVWTWGFMEEDVKRPKAKTQSEYSKTYREKQKVKLLSGLSTNFKGLQND